MATSINRMTNPGPLVQDLVKNLERQILHPEECAAEATCRVRWKIAQAVALAALSIIAFVAAFVLTSLYAPSYAPFVLLGGTYLIMTYLKPFLVTHFRNEWRSIEREAAKIQAIAQKYLKLNDVDKQTLTTTYTPSDETALQKYAYLASYHDYWLDQSKQDIEAAKNEAGEADLLFQQVQTGYLKAEDKRNAEKNGVRHAIYAQHKRESALEARVEALFMKALMHRPDYKGKKAQLYETRYAPIPLSQADLSDKTENEMSFHVSFESPWAKNLVLRELSNQDIFLHIGEKESFLRSEICESPEKSEKIVHAFIAAMDALMSQTLDQSRSSDSA